ncbi:hypothetical protein [Bailinhaonella thermotolerans]|uniref:DUF3800 domain-containing protein n=1 Tax=Bailinhaonella thermotolerans TaxID=1070861 RepID=A0A3A4AQT2_9ACTN|nr:hypothetical protein [Bailinhaonella thermotolerans]RJL23618.1 hypothetical protein D5H75_32475 [Bailinhaonella thermotolerans]
MTRVAYVDESIHDRHGLYVVAGVVAEPRLSAVVQRELSAAAPFPGGPHWHAERAQVRWRLVRAIAELPVRASVHAARFPEPKAKEAARARAMERLVRGLEPEVGGLVLHTREAAQNKLDRRLLRALAGRAPRFRYDHQTSDKEPLIWLPDIVAGAAAAHLIDPVPAYLRVLAPVLAVLEVEETPTEAENFTRWGRDLGA